MNVDINSASASLSKGGSRPRNLVAMVDQSGYLEVRLHTIELSYATSLECNSKAGTGECLHARYKRCQTILWNEQKNKKKLFNSIDLVSIQLENLLFHSFFSLCLYFSRTRNTPASSRRKLVGRRAKNNDPEKQERSRTKTSITYQH